MTFRTPIKVCFGDIDNAGIVYYPRFMHYFHLAIEDMIANEDDVWVRMTATGTNLGSFIGPPTGKPIRVAVFDVLRFANGKIVAHWGVPDRFAVMHQLGLIPQPQAR